MRRGGGACLSEAARNLRAFFSLPLMFLGLARDPWQPFDDYAAVEDGQRSTFFLVPFKGRPGIAPDGTVASTRAVPYQVSEVAHQARSAASRGSELAVHGIDAWRDSAAGREELAQLTAITGTATTGIRMHWLYFDRTSPNQLDAAGFEYNSTWGYNETVGYRAGTSQVFRFPGTSRLLELPLSSWIRRCFSGRRMGLASAQALELCLPLVRNARQFGGSHCHQLARTEPGSRKALGPLLPDVDREDHCGQQGLVRYRGPGRGVVPLAPFAEICCQRHGPRPRWEVQHPAASSDPPGKLLAGSRWRTLSVTEARHLNSTVRAHHAPRPSFNTSTDSFEEPWPTTLFRFSTW